MSDGLAAVIGERGRGGAHKRSRADERELAAAVARRLGIEPRPSLRELWLAHGFGDGARERLGTELGALFELEPGLAKVARPKLEALGNRAPDGRRKAAEWWLKLAHGKSSRRTEALLCRPQMTDALGGQLERERHPQVREALTGALALVVAGHFPDAAQGDRLAALVGDRHAGVRFFAVQGLAGLLGRGAPEGALEQLGSALRDGATGVGSAASTALERAVGEGRVSAEAVMALGSGGDAR